MEKSKEIVQPQTVLEKILDWSKGRPLWQRDALNRILQKNQITDKDIEDFVCNLKAENKGELDKSSVKPLNKDDLPSSSSSATTINITKISNISHVNNLADDQELTFSDKGITLIYGGNGTGKSGYTRILKSACRARHRDRILTNVFASEFMDETPAASITYNTIGKPEETISWEDSDKPDKVLSAVSVFDRECAAIQIQKKGNEIAFRPYGLDIPDTLADVCKRVEGKLKSGLKEFENSQNAIFNNPPWTQGTRTGRIASEITKDTKPEELENICKFTDDDEERLKSLNEILSKDIWKAVNEENNKLQRLFRFNYFLRTTSARLSQAKLDMLLKKRAIVENSREAAKISASKMLDGDVLPEIGSEIWKQLWLAAKEYSISAAYPGKTFPNTGDNSKCVLCHQYLKKDAKERMIAFEKHITGDLEGKAQQSKEDFEKLYSESVFDYINFAEFREVLEDIRLNSPDIINQVRRYLASIRLRQFTFKRAVTKFPEEKLSAYSSSPFELIDDLIDKHQAYERELKQAANDDGRAKLKAERTDLRDKKRIQENKNALFDELKRQHEIELIKSCLKDTSTRSITHLGNSIADEVITPNIKDRFQKEIEDLVGGRVNVEIKRSGGRYGSPKYTVSLLLSSPGTDLSTVLSEGEQSCVAIAAFLAELATSSHKSALVFDDPVSSLDHDWRHKVADRLAKEAKTRQVIVFTHDLVFMNDIEDSSKSNCVDFESRQLMRTPDKVGLVNENLSWVGMSIGARIDALEKEARQLQKKRDELTQDKYNTKAGSFYSKIRAAWERALEEVGLCRIVVRHRDYINPKEIVKLSALSIYTCEDWYNHYSRCCDFVSAHDPSSARNRPLPEPSGLLEECNYLSNWVRSVKESQKAVIPT